jgi:hypothetical protein
LVLKFNFIIFQFLLVRGKKGHHRNPAWREKGFVSIIPTTKILDFCSKWLHIIRGV